MKILKTFYLLCCFLLMGLTFVQGQNPQYSANAWNVQSLHGLIALEGEYRQQETILRSNYSDNPKTSMLNAQFLLNSQSYFWHPNFIYLDADLEFRPGARQENFIVAPDRSETLTAEKIHLKSTFFKQRPLSLNLFGNLDHNYINRELTTNVEMIRTNVGGGFDFRNRTLPVSLNFSLDNWTQKELDIGREFKNKRNNIWAETNKFFGKRHDHRLRYSYEDYRRQYENNVSVNNKIHNINLQSNVHFNGNGESGLNSLIWYFNQRGSQTFDRLQVNENLRIKLPENFGISGNYQYARYDQSAIDQKQHNFLTRLEHRLFFSLRSQIYYEYAYITQPVFKEDRNTVGFGLDYRKRIPSGILRLSYDYRRRNENRDSQPAVLRVLKEALLLEDGRTVLLENPFVNPQSVVVSDASGTIIYQENIDYLLIQRGDFLEIQRLTGGLIPNGGTVFVDYEVSQQLSYRFDAISNGFGASVMLFRNFLEVYFRAFEQDYDNVSGSAFRILKTVSQRLYGTRLTFKMLSGGFEYDDYQSNIVPYRSQRYFLTIAQTVGNRVNFSITGNLRDYTLTADNEKQKFADVSGRIVYFFSRDSKFNIDGGYRFQEGRGLDLDLTTLRAEYLTRFRQFYTGVGMVIFRRDFSGEVINFDRFYVRLERRF